MANAILGAPFYTSIFSPESGLFLNGGTIRFFGSDQITPKPVYRSPDTTQTPYPNPFDLNSIAVMPPMYFLEDEPYWVEVYPALLAGACSGSVDPIYSFLYYPASQGTNSANSDVFNYLSNPQFLHILPFNNPPVIDTPTFNPTRITQVTTEINQAWWLDVDSPATNTVLVTYPSAATQQDPGNPFNFVNIQVSAIGSSMQFLDLYQYIGEMNFLQNEDVTLSVLGIATNGVSAVTLQVLVETNDQNGQLTLTPVGNLAFTNSLDTAVLNFKMPPINSGNPNVFSYNRIIFRFPLLQVTSLSLTNAQIENGTILQPAFIQEPTDLVNAKTFMNDFNFPSDVNTQANQSQFGILKYYNNQFMFMYETGKISVYPANAVPEDVYPLGDTRINLNIHEYWNKIPLSRLFGVIGNEFGTGGLTATAAANVVTAVSLSFGTPFAPWNAETSGFTITQTVIPGQYGVLATPTANPNTVRLTFTENYAPNPNPLPPPSNPGANAPNIQSWAGSAINLGAIGSLSNRTSAFITGRSPGFPFDPPFSYLLSAGNNSINVNVVNTGSSSTPAIVDVSFSAQNVADYKTMSVKGTPIVDSQYPPFAQYNSLEFGTKVVNTRGNYAYAQGISNPTPSAVSIQFSVDGNISAIQGGSVATVTVPFLSSNTLKQNVQVFLNTINTKFQYTITVPAFPALQPGNVGPGFVYSSVVATDCIWFTIGGVGTQPTFGGVTNYYLIPLAGTETTATVATLIAQKIQTSNAFFAIPSKADYFIPGSPLLVAGIHV